MSHELHELVSQLENLKLPGYRMLGNLDKGFRMASRIVKAPAVQARRTFAAQVDRKREREREKNKVIQLS